MKKYLIIFLLLTSCAKKPGWPASVTFQSLDSSQTETALNYLKSLSEETKMELFNFNKVEGNFKIIITKKSFNQNENYLGLATVTEVGCLVQLNEIIFLNSDFKDYFKPVLYHELGHCAGMIHDPKEGEIMFHVGSPESFYTQDAFNRFFNQLANFVNSY